MNIKTYSGLLMTILLSVASGCSNDRMDVNDPARGAGNYSNPNRQNKTTGLFADQDGPITEFMNHRYWGEGEIADKQRQVSLQTRDENGNPPNPTAPLAADDQFLKKDNRFSTGDANYHDHLNQNSNNTGFSIDHQALARISDKIRKKTAGVKNVRNVRSVVYGSSVLVAIDLQDKSKAASTKRAVQKAVQPYANGRVVTVITDEGTFSRDRNNQSGVRAEGGK